MTLVPNVPCGVESQTARTHFYAYTVFLMYRVELKVNRVELDKILKDLFLMYRVELKDFFLSQHPNSFVMMFLMYRVELKARIVPLPQ